MPLNGIHHISAITGDARRNLDFYTRVLGLRLVAKTVNQDDPGVYHLFYGSEDARPGADLTFFEYPRAIPGRPRAGVLPRRSPPASPAPRTPGPGPAWRSSSTPGRFPAAPGPGWCTGSCRASAVPRR